MKKIVVGAVEITRVEESLAPSFEPAFLFPEWRPEYLEQYGWMEPHFYDRGAGKFMSSIHSWVIRTKHHLIVVDTCAGNDKSRPSFERFNMLRSSYLERLQSAGIRPEDVTHVLCTPQIGSTSCRARGGHSV